MPRLNYGTLLENIVVLESTRLGLEHTAAEDALGFATSFAMPPITSLLAVQIGPHDPALDKRQR